MIGQNCEFFNVCLFRRIRFFNYLFILFVQEYLLLFVEMTNQKMMRAYKLNLQSGLKIVENAFVEISSTLHTSQWGRWGV